MSGNSNHRLDRREFLHGGATLLGSALGLSACSSVSDTNRRTARVPDATLRIAPFNLEIAPGIVIPTTAYNDRVPGPLIRVPQGRQIVIDVTNHTANKELAHWHGLHIPSEMDGAEEEGTPPVMPGETRRYAFLPQPTGTHWYHTHHMGHEDLSVGGYTGQYGFFVIDAPNDPGRYDQEVFLAMHHWGAHWVKGQMLHPDQTDHGLEVAYTHASMNDRMLGHGDPVRVVRGQRVLFRMLNASATEITFTHLPGHRFKVLTMDGTVVPAQREIDVLMLGPGERADVLVEMNRPGVWIMGSTEDEDRAKGMGIVVEYAGASGSPMWQAPAELQWDYLWFGRSTPAAPPDERIELRVTQKLGGATGHDSWPVNGEVWPFTRDIKLVKDRRYRLTLINETGHGHPLHLHRHSFEVASYKGVASSGLVKDVINVMPFSTVEVDFVANNVGPTLFHCHQVKHQDFGLMTLMMYEGDESAAARQASVVKALQVNERRRSLHTNRAASR